MKQDVLRFIRQVDEDFTTPLSARVDLEGYAAKLMNQASLSTVIDNGTIIGLVAIYCNNLGSRYAYIPFVAIKSQMRGKGLSRLLMLNAISIARAKGFEKIGLHTDNLVALNLYQSLGFKVLEDNKRKYLELDLK